MEQCDQPLVLWGRFRDNDVRVIKNLTVTFCPAKMFGRQLSNGPAMPGTLFNTSWPAIVHYQPTALAVQGDCTPFQHFLERLKSCPTDMVKFFSQLAYLRVENSNLDVQSFLCLMQYSPTVSVIELLDSPEMGNLKQSHLDVIFAKRTVSAMSVGNLPMKLVNPIFRHLRNSLRLLCFGGTSAMTMDELCNLRVVMCAVEMLILQNLALDDLQSLNHFFRGIAEYFPNLKHVFIDWKFISPVVVFDSQTTVILKDLCYYMKNSKLTTCAILFYAPDEFVQAEVSKVVAYVKDEEKLPCVRHDFSCLPDDDSAPNNFVLFLVGQQTEVRTVRLFETVVKAKVTNPNLAHFVRIVDTEDLMTPDAFVQFAGFDGHRVRLEFENCTADSGDVAWVPDHLLRDVVNEA